MPVPPPSVERVMTKSAEIGHPTSSHSRNALNHLNSASSPNAFPHSRTTRGRRDGVVATIPSASAHSPTSVMPAHRRSISSSAALNGSALAIVSAPRSPSGFLSRFRYRKRSPSRTILATDAAPTSHTALHRRFRHSRCRDAATPYAASVSIPPASTRHFPIFKFAIPLDASIRAAWKTCSDWCVNSRDGFSIPSDLSVVLSSNTATHSAVTPRMPASQSPTSSSRRIALVRSESAMATRPSSPSGLWSIRRLSRRHDDVAASASSLVSDPPDPPVAASARAMCAAPSGPMSLPRRSSLLTAGDLASIAAMASAPASSMRL
mmetsp:Transcript_12096/g.48536  ORF Transcript_12096/g.48536 Transcript_12096/m.48536 type:complete len:321 (+) Transcript_12096:243-1205(+)